MHEPPAKPKRWPEVETATESGGGGGGGSKCLISEGPKNYCCS